jgi:hypothetical protein
VDELGRNPIFLLEDSLSSNDFGIKNFLHDDDVENLTLLLVVKEHEDGKK